MKTKEKIVCVHLLNDFSGSPNMLKQAILVLQKKGYQIDVVLNKETKGFLTDIPEVTYHYVSYNFASNKLLTLWRLFYYQLLVFRCLYKNYKKEDITLLINSAYPMLAGLFGKWYNKKVVYYIQETKINPFILKKLLLRFVKKCNTKLLYVSNYVAEATSEFVGKQNANIIYNTIDKSFTETNNKVKTIEDKFHVIFISSLKDFKGVDTFIAVVDRLKENSSIHFTMKLNGDANVIAAFKEKNKAFGNLKIIDSKDSIHNLYQEGHLLLNLTKPSLCLETFGLTILEGFSYGIPAVVPNAGGPTEVVNHNENGYCIDVENTDAVVQCIDTLYNDQVLYENFSKAALERTGYFSQEKYEKGISELFESLT